ncbi:hypothetical protein Q5Y75_16240 [Ruegeria sp. 2205SS24-7]|uniref:hypothetical protein n=1 Tax=Ruegeria discodermiae TaxID=3064389 RepID=UPI0027410759|nr:hypothetical protein [Ruegeria sp. 2205SS24-7]MDP5218780.1 hypothetical protein [Ruegeria sp. 2205SS24-7]
MLDHANSETPTALPATPKQIAYARQIAERQNITLPWEVQQDRTLISAWIDAQLAALRMRDTRPSSKQVAFAERIARIKRRDVPDECYRDRKMMTRWIDSNKP